MDITEFKLANGKKAYLQVVMDNYSRKVVSFKLSRFKNQKMSLKSILTSMKHSNPKILMTDAGGENTSIKVKNLLFGKGVISHIAKKDVFFSNSMVESFFRTLKMRFINKYRSYKFSKLYNQIARSVLVFNNMPYGDFNGATPNEIYAGVVHFQSLKQELKEKVLNSMETRLIDNKVCFRKKCYTHSKIY